MNITTLTDRFWSKVIQDGDCWVWTGARNSNGYGQWAVTGRSRSVHRLAYEAFVGPIPDGLVLDHLCRRRTCLNPDHLEPVTDAENSRRSALTLTSINTAKTHCLRGHPLSGDNLVMKKRGARPPVRNCRECANDAARRRRHSAYAA